MNDGLREQEIRTGQVGPVMSKKTAGAFSVEARREIGVPKRNGTATNSRSGKLDGSPVACSQEPRPLLPPEGAPGGGPGERTEDGSGECTGDGPGERTPDGPGERPGDGPRDGPGGHPGYRTPGDPGGVWPVLAHPLVTAMVRPVFRAFQK
jgi:hypothetical protein